MIRWSSSFKTLQTWQIDRNCMECIRCNAKVKISGSARPRVLVFRTALSLEPWPPVPNCVSIVSDTSVTRQWQAKQFSLLLVKTVCYAFGFIGFRRGSELASGVDWVHSKFWDDMLENWFYLFCGMEVAFQCFPCERYEVLAEAQSDTSH